MPNLHFEILYFVFPTLFPRYKTKPLFRPVSSDNCMITNVLFCLPSYLPRDEIIAPSRPCLHHPRNQFHIPRSGTYSATTTSGNQGQGSSRFVSACPDPCLLPNQAVANETHTPAPGSALPTTLVRGASAKSCNSLPTPRIVYQDVAPLQRRGCALGMHRATDSKRFNHQ